MMNQLLKAMQIIKEKSSIPIKHSIINENSENITVKEIMPFELLKEEKIVHVEEFVAPARKVPFNIINELFDGEGDLNREIARIRKEIRDNEALIKKYKDTLASNAELTDKGKSEIEERIADIEDENDMLRKELINYTKSKSEELKKEHMTNIFFPNAEYNTKIEAFVESGAIKRIHNLKIVSGNGSPSLIVENGFIRTRLNTILLEFLNFFKGKEKKIKDRLAEIDDILETRNEVMKQNLEDIKEITAKIEDLEQRKRRFEMHEEEKKLKDKKDTVDKERKYIAELEDEQRKLMRELKDLENQNKKE